MDIPIVYASVSLFYTYVYDCKQFGGCPVLKHLPIAVRIGSVVLVLVVGHWPQVTPMLRKHHNLHWTLLIIIYSMLVGYVMTYSWRFTTTYQSASPWNQRFRTMINIHNHDQPTLKTKVYHMANKIWASSWSTTQNEHHHIEIYWASLDLFPFV